MRLRRCPADCIGQFDPMAATKADGALRNLFICGTDQGLVGIIGSMISGITIANRYLLRDGGAGANP